MDVESSNKEWVRSNATGRGCKSQAVVEDSELVRLFQAA